MYNYFDLFTMFIEYRPWTIRAVLVISHLWVCLNDLFRNEHHRRVHNSDMCALVDTVITATAANRNATLHPSRLIFGKNNGDLISSIAPFLFYSFASKNNSRSKANEGFTTNISKFKQLVLVIGQWNWRTSEQCKKNTVKCRTDCKLTPDS